MLHMDNQQHDAKMGRILSLWRCNSSTLYTVNNILPTIFYIEVCYSMCEHATISEPKVIPKAENRRRDIDR